MIQETRSLSVKVWEAVEAAAYALYLKRQADRATWCEYCPLTGNCSYCGGQH